MCEIIIHGNADGLNLFNNEVRTDFNSWLKIIKGEPTIYNKDNRIIFGIPYEHQKIKWHITPFSDDDFTGVLKFVCASEKEITNDNLQV